MLSYSNQQDVISALRPVMAKAGFRRRESTWYRFSRSTIQVLDVQPAASRSSQRIYFNLGVTLRKLRPGTHPRVFDCPVYGRMDHIVPDGEPFAHVSDFAVAAITRKERISKLVEFVQRFALPLLDSWRTEEAVETFAKSKQSAGFSIRYLNLQNQL